MSYDLFVHGAATGLSIDGWMTELSRVGLDVELHPAATLVGHESGWMPARLMVPAASPLLADLREQFDDVEDVKTLGVKYNHRQPRNQEQRREFLPIQSSHFPSKQRLAGYHCAPEDS